MSRFSSYEQLPLYINEQDHGLQEVVVINTVDTVPSTTQTNKQHTFSTLIWVLSSLLMRSGKDSTLTDSEARV